jgi:ubiquinone/menaquinone biosynthesis C-methylase UbiE
LLSFLRLGFEPSNLYGVDIRTEKLDTARTRFPSSHFQCADASQLEFPDASFDITQEFMMFLQLTDDDLSGRVAAEMLRVTKVGGHLVLSDWRYAKPGTDEFKAVNKARISKLFHVGRETEVVKIVPGALVPPVGRLFSRVLPSMYFAVRSCFPFLVVQFVTVLRKTR